MSGLRYKLSCAAQWFCDHAYQSTRKATYQPYGRGPLFDQRFDGVVSEASYGPKETDSNPAKAIDKTVTDALRQRTSENFVPLTVLSVKRESVEITRDTGGEVGH